VRKHNGNGVSGLDPVVGFYRIPIYQDVSGISRSLNPASGCPFQLIKKEFIDSQRSLTGISQESEVLK
jgi:hypothetical protein